MYDASSLKYHFKNSRNRYTLTQPLWFPLQFAYLQAFKKGFVVVMRRINVLISQRHMSVLVRDYTDPGSDTKMNENTQTVLNQWLSQMFKTTSNMSPCHPRSIENNASWAPIAMFFVS